MTTPNLSLAELVQNQSQPHVPINSAMRKLDAVVQLSVLSRSALPVGSPSPVDGDRYISTEGDSLDQIVQWESGGWTYYTPSEGWLAYVQDEQAFYVYQGTGSPTGWEILTTGGGGGTLASLTDVDLTGRSDGDLLAYDSGSGDYIHVAPSAGGGGAVSLGEGVSVTQSAAQSIPNAALTALQFDTILRQDGSLFTVGSPATDTTVVTIPSDGWYSVTGFIEWPGFANAKYLELHKNDSRIAYRYGLVSGEILQIAHVGYFTAGDELTLKAYQSSGSAQNSVGAGTLYPVFSVAQIAAGFIGAKASMSTGSQSISNTTDTPITNWDTSEFDSHSMWGGSLSPTETSRMYAPFDGIYLVGANIKWPGASMTGATQLFFRKNGSATYGRSLVTASNDGMQSTTALIELAQGDYVEALCWQNSGTAKTLDVSGEQAFWMTKQ